jgi:hypothetical protein
LPEQFVFCYFPILHFVSGFKIVISDFPPPKAEGWRGVPNGKVPLSKSGGRKPMRVRLSPPPPEIVMSR